VTQASREATGTPRSIGEEADAVAVDAAAAAAEPEPRTAQPSAVDATRFAHASEAEMARILDFYDVRWEYEPTTFPILWNLDGEVVESFAPDFYLPELGVFLEMTTLKQRLVRKKNRKLRRLRELYPDIRIKLFYARDFRAMMLKYGRLGLAASLSGTLGQVVPERVAAEPEVAPALLATALAADEPASDAEPVPLAATSATSAPSVIDAAIVSQPPRTPPRSRSGRRRRRANVTEAGAEREAEA
jgi:hypoxanthine phosphoribosyltransferase